MPRTRASAAAGKTAEPEKPVETEEHVELGADDEEEPMEEEVEYEEVEEEVEEEEEEEEEEVEEEVEEEEEEEENDAQKQTDSDDNVENAEGREELEKKHSELLALPPHGSEVYLGGISHDTSEDDLKRICESIGEVTEVK